MWKARTNSSSLIVASAVLVAFAAFAWSGSAVSATVGIGSNDSGGFGLEVELDVELPALEREAAEALAAKAHQVCPYSNATRGNIDVTVSVV